MTEYMLYIHAGTVLAIGFVIGFLYGQVRMLRRHEYLMLDIAMRQIKKETSRLRD
jgi:uncharacterized membrane protein YciS (DUF1049 family)